MSLFSREVAAVSTATPKQQPLLPRHRRKQYVSDKARKEKLRLQQRYLRIREKQMIDQDLYEQSGPLPLGNTSSGPLQHPRLIALQARAVLVAAQTYCVGSIQWTPGQNYKLNPRLRNIKRTIRRLRHKIVKRIVIFKEQVGFFDQCRNTVDTMQTITDIVGRAKYQKVNNSVSDSLVARAEDLILLATSLSQSTSVTQFAASLLLYVRTHHPRAFTPVIFSWVKSILGDHDVSFKEQAGEWDEQTKEKIDNDPFVIRAFKEFMVVLRLGLSNWSKIVNSRMFKNVTTFLTILTTTGLLKELPAQLAPISSFFSRKLEPKVRESRTIYEAFMEVLLFTAEKVTEFITTGNWKDLFTDHKEVDELTDEYNVLMTALPLLDANKLHELSDNRVKGISNTADLAYRIVTLITRVRALRNNESNEYVKNGLNQKLSNLLGLEAALIRCQKTTIMRERPFCVQIFGPSGVAKSTLIEAVKKQVCDANNIPYEDHNVVYINEADKFDTEFTHHTTVVVLDDLGNVNPDRNDGKSPTQMIIDLVNNIPKLAVKADLADKGNVPKAAQLVIITTNIEDMHAKLYSSEPASILRRMDVVMKVSLRQTHSDKKTNTFSRNAFIENRNAWSIDYGQIKITRSDVKTVKDDFEFAVEQTDGSLLQALTYLRTMSVEHFDAQRHFVHEMRSIRKAKYCKHGHISYFCDQGCFNAVDLTDEPSVEVRKFEGYEAMFGPQLVFRPDEVEEKKHVAEECPTAAAALKDLLADQGAAFCDLVVSRPSYSPIDEPGHIVDHLVSIDHGDIGSVGTPCPSLDDYQSVQQQSGLDDVPEDMVEDWENVCHMPMENAISSAQRWWFRTSKELWMKFLPRPKFMKFKDLVEIRLNAETTPFMELEIDLKQLYLTKWRTAASVLLGAAAAAALYGIVHLIRTTRAAEKMLQQNDSEEEIPNENGPDNIFGPPVENIWKKPVYIPPPTTEVSDTMTIKQLNNMVDRSIAVMRIKTGDAKWSYCNTLPLCSNLWIVPKHMLPPYGDKAQGVIEYQSDDELGRVYEFILGSANRYDLKDDDFSIIQVVSSGSQVNFFNTMPDKRTTSAPIYCTHQYRNKNDYSTALKRVRMGSQQSYRHPSGDFTERWAVPYDYMADTFPGLCMATLCAYTTKPYILGFHRAGSSDSKNLALATMVDREMFWPALQYFKPKGLMVADAGVFPLELYGKKLTLQSCAHKHHCVNFITDLEGRRPNVEVYGTLNTPRAKFKSNVHTSPISELVTEEMRLEKKHGAPSTVGYNKHWQRDLQKVVCAHNAIDPDLLELAMNDAKKLYEEKVPQRMLDKARPLTLDESLAGIDGAYAIDSMNFSTSVGFPLNQKKNKFVSDSTRTVPGITRPKDLDPMYEQMVKDIEDRLASGQRWYTIFRACLKDEPTKYTKDKIRVFNAAEFAFSIVGRKYLLPLLAILQTIGNDVGVTVGTNCYSEQWTRLYDHLSKHGHDRFIAGDYAAFDKNMSSVIARAGDQILLWLAERCPHYSERDRTIILGLITESVYPVVEYDGVLMQFKSSTPSGTMTTVYNNIFRQIILSRLTYYFEKLKRVAKGEIKLEDIPVFHTVVAEAYYGDDDAESVSRSEQDYNHVSKTLFLETIGIKFTLPDKTRGLNTKFMTKKTLTLLKRSFVWDTKLQRYRCPIEEDSIARMLHCYMKSKAVLPEQQSADAINNAAREFYQHGRATYDSRVRQLMRVARRAGIDDMLQPIPTYDEFTENLKKGYFIPDVPATTEYDLQSEDYCYFASDEPATIEYDQQSGEEESILPDEDMNSLLAGALITESHIDRTIENYCLRHFGVPLDRVWPTMPEWPIAGPLLMRVLQVHNFELYSCLYMEEMLVQMNMFTGPRYEQQDRRS